MEAPPIKNLFFAFFFAFKLLNTKCLNGNRNGKLLKSEQDQNRTRNQKSSKFGLLLVSAYGAAPHTTSHFGSFLDQNSGKKRNLKILTNFSRNRTEFRPIANFDTSKSVFISNKIRKCPVRHILLTWTIAGDTTLRPLSPTTPLRIIQGSGCK